MTDAVLSVELQLTKLVLAGARYIVVGNAPDIALAPATDQLTGYRSNSADLDIAEWDLADFLSNQIKDADILGYTNTEDACTDSGALPDCEGFVFIDGVHPTTVVHQQAGQNILQLLAQ